MPLAEEQKALVAAGADRSVPSSPTTTAKSSSIFPAVANGDSRLRRYDELIVWFRSKSDPRDVDARSPEFRANTHELVALHGQLSGTGTDSDLDAVDAVIPTAPTGRSGTFLLSAW